MDCIIILVVVVQVVVMMMILGVVEAIAVTDGGELIRIGVRREAIGV